MSSVGRNDPCPCGSGLKFKRCCLKKEQTTAAYTAGDRDSALAKLMRFATRSEFDDKHREALALFWGDWLSEEPDEDLKRVVPSFDGLWTADTVVIIAPSPDYYAIVVACRIFQITKLRCARNFLLRWLLSGDLLVSVPCI
jgi:SEC-C motif